MSNNINIENIILDYCEGTHHLEFCKDDLDEMVEEIKNLVKREIRDYSEHVSDAVRCIDNL